MYETGEKETSLWQPAMTHRERSTTHGRGMPGIYQALDFRTTLHERITMHDEIRRSQAPMTDEQAPGTLPAESR